jgi:hypothetical protein
MDPRTDAPEWREPPRRVGPIDEDCDWAELVIDNTVAITMAIAVVTLLLAAYAWGFDWFAGHLHG